MSRPVALTMPDGDGMVEAEGIADGNHPVAGQQGVGVAERQRNVAPLRLGTNQRDVRLRIRPDDLGLRAGPVREDDLDLLHVLDDVVVGHDQAFLRDHEAGSQAGNREAPGCRRLLRPLRATEGPSEELAKETAEREAQVGKRLHHRLRGVDVDHARRDLPGQDGESRVGALPAHDGVRRDPLVARHRDRYPLRRTQRPAQELGNRHAPPTRRVRARRCSRPRARLPAQSHASFRSPSAHGVDDRHAMILQQPRSASRVSGSARETPLPPPPDSRSGPQTP